MRKILQILVVTFILSSCGKYQKVLRSDDYNYKYEQAVAYYEDGDYNRAMPLFNELSTVMKGTSKIQEVSFYYAYCNYSTRDNLMAAYLFRNYTINFPNSKHTAGLRLRRSVVRFMTRHLCPIKNALGRPRGRPTIRNTCILFVFI